jgi:CO dehydrogenase maturation factor
MKLAVSGKGGVGKTTVACLLCFAFQRLGYSVLAVDADPNATLAAAMGFPHPGEIIPLSQMADLIEERTGARPGQLAPYFKLNPRVDDIPRKYWVEHEGIKLLVMGGLRPGGGGCYCPENALLQALIAHLFLERDEVVIMDMEAGVEHLGRGTARGVDEMIIVVEPGRGSVETACRIKTLAQDIGINNVAAVGNKVHNGQEKEFLLSSLPQFKFLGFIPYQPSIVEADRGGLSLRNIGGEVAAAISTIADELIKETIIGMANN